MFDLGKYSRYQKHLHFTSNKFISYKTTANRDFVATHMLPNPLLKCKTTPLEECFFIEHDAATVLLEIILHFSGDDTKDFYGD